MPFCPVPHTTRDGVWLGVGLGLGAVVTRLALQRLATTATAPDKNPRPGSPEKYPRPGYTWADQVKRHARAKEEVATRVLSIERHFDGSYLKGKRVLVTGGNQGLGLAIVRQLVESSAEVVVVGRRSSPELDALAGVQVITGVDVADTAAVGRMVQQISAPLDYVINNAGYFWSEHETLANMNFDEQLKQIDICGVGPLRVSHALLQAGLVARCGAIILITSQAGSVEWRFTQNPDGGDYGHHMSRAACNMGGVLLAQELRAKGVPVLLLHPGFNKTGMTAKYAHIWEEEGAVDPAVGAMRVLHEVGDATMARTGMLINCEDGLQIPW